MYCVCAPRKGRKIWYHKSLEVLSVFPLLHAWCYWCSVWCDDDLEQNYRLCLVFFFVCLITKTVVGLLILVAYDVKFNLDKKCRRKFNCAARVRPLNPYDYWENYPGAREFQRTRLSIRQCVAVVGLIFFSFTSAFFPPSSMCTFIYVYWPARGVHFYFVARDMPANSGGDRLIYHQASKQQQTKKIVFCFVPLSIQRMVIDSSSSIHTMTRVTF